MCGINGFNWQDQNLLNQMNMATQSRGPDYTGTYSGTTLNMSHLLLAIRESSEISRQPRQDRPEWVLLLNGQIYNTKQLSEGLADLDPRQKDLDTYILYKFIEKKGWDFIQYIHGMFAIVLLNTRTNELRLYRDPAGQKQLYYYHKAEQFIFSSELKGILEHDIDKTIDQVGLGVATTIGYIPGAKTIFRYIHKINPSEYISWNIGKRELTHHWFGTNEKDYFLGNPGQVFSQLIEEHLQSKQKIALNLSGGMDSAILLHEMSRTGKNIHTYTTYFEDIDGDDKYNRDALFARQLAQDYHSEHHEIAINKKSFIDNFIQSYSLIEEPNFNVSLPVYLQTAKTEGVYGDKNRVIISGDGGDEVFGGYPHYAEARRVKHWACVLTPWVFNYIKNRRNHTNYDFMDPSELWLFFRRLNFNSLHNQGSNEQLKYIKETADNLARLKTEKGGLVYETMLRDRYLWMPGENFIRSDKLFMSQSAEMRSPFAFGPFRAYMDKLLREGDYADKNWNKVFVRRLYTGKLPDYITKRKDKTGWRSPVSRWYDNEMKQLFLSIISPMKVRRHLVDWKRVEKLIIEKDGWPGKSVHLYLSLAILANQYKIVL